MKLHRILRGLAVLTLAISVAVPAVSASGNQEKRIRVGGEIKEPKKIKDVKPVYPEDAEKAGIQGIVILETIIGTDGSVQEAKILRGVAQLDKAALDAVIQWRYTPTLLNGEPVEIVMTVTVSFKLG